MSSSSPSSSPTSPSSPCTSSQPLIALMAPIKSKPAARATGPRETSLMERSIAKRAADKRNKEGEDIKEPKKGPGEEEEEDDEEEEEEDGEEGEEEEKVEESEASDGETDIEDADEVKHRVPVLKKPSGEHKCVLPPKILKRFEGKKLEEKLELFRTIFASGNYSSPELVAMVNSIFSGNDKHNIWPKVHKESLGSSIFTFFGAKTRRKFCWQ